MRLSTTLCCSLVFVCAMQKHSEAEGSIFKPSFTSSERFGETYTASFLGDDSSVFLFQFIFSNAGFGDRKGACRLLAIPKGTQGKNFAARFDSDEWAFDANKNRLNVGGCSLSGKDNSVVFSTTIDGKKATLTIRDNAKPKPFPKISAKEGFFEAEVLITGAAATVRWQGKDTPGFAYLDHTRSTATMSDMVKAVYRVRLMHKETLLFNVSDGPLGKRGWMYATGEEQLAPLSASKITIAPSSATPKISVSLSTGKASLSVDKVLYRYRPVEAYGMLGRLASPIIGNPETTTFLVKVKQADGTVRRGLMERTLVSP